MELNLFHIEEIVLDALQNLIRRQKGGCLTFTAKYIARLAGLNTKPVTLTLISYVLKKLEREGLIGVYKRSKKTTKYIITCNSPLWKALKEGKNISIRIIQ